jgi:hypothetical protein
MAKVIKKDTTKAKAIKKKTKAKSKAKDIPIERSPTMEERERLMQQFYGEAREDDDPFIKEIKERRKEREARRRPEEILENGIIDKVGTFIPFGYSFTADSDVNKLYIWESDPRHPNYELVKKLEAHYKASEPHYRKISRETRKIPNKKAKDTDNIDNLDVELPPIYYDIPWKTPELETLDIPPAIMRELRDKYSKDPENRQENGDRDARGHFVKGNSFGDSSGYKHRRTRFLEAITQEKADEILGDFLTLCTEGKQAVKGDVDCILFALKRLYPETGQKSFTKFPIGPTKTMEDLKNAHSTVIKGVEEDELDPKDAKDIQELLMNKHKLIESTDIQQQMEQLMNMASVKG